MMIISVSHTPTSTHESLYYQDIYTFWVCGIGHNFLLEQVVGLKYI